MYLIVGLGNPGLQYATTRHNIGWMVLTQAADQWSIPFSTIGYARLGQGFLGQESVTLALPLTWMNQTGEIVKALVDECQSTIPQLIVVHDDLDLDAGRIRIKQRGGSGGHNGIHSLIRALGTDEFLRIKVGIGRPSIGQEPSDYVLSPFSPSEVLSIKIGLDSAVTALECLIHQGVARAMERFNTRKPQEEDS